MRALIQRASEARVVIGGQVTGEINEGLLILIGITRDDTAEDFEWIIRKSMNMRIFNDHEGVMNLSCEDVKGQYLLVSQFTLYASTKKGNRPSYIAAAPPDVALQMFDDFVYEFASKAGSQRVHTGKFDADMKVSLTNDGPVTIWLDSKNKT